MLIVRIGIIKAFSNGLLACNSSFNRSVCQNGLPVIVGSISVSHGIRVLIFVKRSDIQFQCVVGHAKHITFKWIFCIILDKTQTRPRTCNMKARRDVVTLCNKTKFYYSMQLLLIDTNKTITTESRLEFLETFEYCLLSTFCHTP